MVRRTREEEGNAPTDLFLEVGGRSAEVGGTSTHDHSIEFDLAIKLEKLNNKTERAILELLSKSLIIIIVFV